MMDLTRNQISHLILADIAMAMAVSAVLGERVEVPDPYQPGAVRDSWLAGRGEEDFKVRRVLALATAGMGSLQEMDGPRLLEQAGRFGVPLDPAEAVAVADHFRGRREAVLTYRR